MGLCSCSPCCNNETQKPSSSDQDIDFDGPLKHRECRDVIFLIFFLAFLVGTGAVTFLAVSQGNPYRLIYGVDSWGNVCNQKNDPIPNVTLSGQDNSDKPYVFFFDPSYFYSLIPNNLLPSITEDQTQIICVKKCPDRNVEVVDFYTNDGVNLCRYGITPYVDDDDKCPDTPVVEHVSKFHRCIPKELYEQLKSQITSFASLLPNVHMGGNLTQTIISDLTNTWKEIGYLGGISIGVALVIVIMMRLLAAVIVWTLVIVTVFLGLGASAYSW